MTSFVITEDDHVLRCIGFLTMTQAVESPESFTKSSRPQEYLYRYKSESAEKHPLLDLIHGETTTAKP